MRTKFSSTVLAPGLLALASLPASAQQHFSKVEVKVEKLSDGVYMLTTDVVIVAQARNGARPS
jgi:hypothetical protein